MSAVVGKLRAVAHGTIWEDRDRLDGLVVAIRKFIFEDAPNATAAELSAIVRSFPGAISGTAARRAVVAEFFDSFSDGTPAATIAAGLEIAHVGH